MKKPGIEYLHNPRLNKGTAFTPEERLELGLTGLLPPRVSTMQQQIERSLANMRAKDNAINKYMFLAALQKRNERLFFRMLIDHITELMPIVYTPTVGQACQEYSSIYRETSGYYLSLRDKGRVEELLSHWPDQDVRLIVATDGERILGLGDLGTNGMGIPIGKLALYCACAGIDPSQCMPIMIDVGTENEELREDPLYLGLRQNRVRGEEYLEFIDEFIQAVKKRFPKALLQFEDFATPNAVSLLEKYRDELLCFNDDIQGTASVALAGLYAATRINNKKLSEMTYLFSGAGSAATGIGDLLSKAMQREGLSEEEANAKLFFIDSQGLVTQNRDYIAEHKKPFAANLPPMSFEEAIKQLKPDALIGATGTAGVFTQSIIETMGQNHESPIIFALSNPTANAECTAEQAYQWTNGRAIFASGSPFNVVHINNEIKIPGQGNNAYIFPGLGLGVLNSGATRVNDEMLISAAEALANSVSQTQIDHGCLYPPLKEIRKVSAKIAVAVAQTAEQCGLTQTPLPQDFDQLIQEKMYDPKY